MSKNKLTKKEKAKRVLEKLEGNGKKVWTCKIGHVAMLIALICPTALIRRCVKQYPLHLRN
jgi:hypothetical protein